MNNEETLKGKSGDWLLKKHEDSLKYFLLPKIPLWLETYHLTWLTALWSLLILICFYLGASERLYLLFVPFIIILQYITDLLDGAVGRERDTGLVRWGYYVDHFFDFIFASSIVMGYGMIIGFSVWLFLIYAVLCGFMIHTFLLVSANNKFNISFLKIGPTEGRFLVIVFHLIFVYLDKIIFNSTIPYIAVASMFLLFVAFLGSHKDLWRVDMENKISK